MPVGQYVTGGKEQASRPVSLYVGRRSQLAGMPLEVENRPVGQSASKQENMKVGQYVTRCKEQASRPVSLYTGRKGQ